MISKRVSGKILKTEIRFYPGTDRTCPQKTTWKIGQRRTTLMAGPLPVITEPTVSVSWPFYALRPPQAGAKSSSRSHLGSQHAIRTNRRGRKGAPHSKTGKKEAGEEPASGQVALRFHGIDKKSKEEEKKREKWRKRKGKSISVKLGREKRKFEGQSRWPIVFRFGCRVPVRAS